ncbi:MAG: DUF4406 domain-containing protein [Bacillota bacterium]
MSTYKSNRSYSDPTANKAMANIAWEEKQIERELKKAQLLKRKAEKKKIYETYLPMVYICSPFAEDVKNNVIRARRFSRFAVLNDRIPFAPHLLFPQFMDDSNAAEREKAIAMGLIMLTKCSEVWCFGPRVSEGMAKELEFAKNSKKRIRYFDADTKEVSPL